MRWWCRSIVSVAGAAVLAGLPVAAAPPAAAGDAALTGVSGLGAGGSLTCAVLTDTTARCWGTGPLGDGGPALAATSPTPVAVEDGAGDPLTGITQVVVAPSGGHACALLADTTAACWGQNLVGELGDGTTVPRLAPVPVETAPASPLTGITQLAAGDYFTCARLSSGQARCWGQNGGALGNGGTANQSRPVAVRAASGAGNLVNVAQVTAGTSHACARLTDRTVRCWGQNGSGQLADGTTSTRLRPKGVLAPSGPGLLGGVVELAAGFQHTCARLANGQARCWGPNQLGQLGIGSVTPPFATVARRPRVVVGPTGTAALTGVAGVAAGTSQSCARRTSGQVRCWGANPRGQVGDGTFTTPRPRVRTVRGLNGTGALTGVSQVVGGGQHTCARLASSEVACWGDDREGQLGDLTPSARRAIPTTILA